MEQPTPPEPESKREKPIAVLAAVAANLVIAAAKFAGAALSGSSAMISEGIHSLVDTGDGLLILLGSRRAARPPDERHPFGHGRELYFWSFIVAIVVFAVGGGMSVYEGVVHLRSPRPLEDPFWSYVVLALAFVAEASSFTIAYRRFRGQRRGLRAGRAFGPAVLWREIRASKDPSVFTVLFEDAAALVGIVIAAAGLVLGHHFHNRAFDGLASILIGLLLALVAVLLARESRGLLVGEGAEPEVLEAVRALARAHPGVERVAEVLTMYLGPASLLLTMDLKFRSDQTSDQIVAIVRDLEAAIRAQFPEVKRISIEAVSLHLSPPAPAPA